MTNTQEIISKLKEEIEELTKYYNELCEKRNELDQLKLDSGNLARIEEITNEIRKTSAELGDKEVQFSTAQEILKARDEEILGIIDDVDIELFFTDIKDTEGRKIKLSDEFMEIINIWWNKKSEELKQQIKSGGKNGV